MSSYAEVNNPLLGSWVLDKETTIAYSISINSLSAIKEKIWNNSKTILTFTENTVVTNYGSEILKSSYVISAINNDVVTINYNNTDKTTTLHLTEKGFYISADQADREYYINNE